MSIKSPLEEFSAIYQKDNGLAKDHEYWNDRIIDDTEEEILYLVPSGYTHYTPHRVKRTEYYRSAWEKAVTLNTEKDLYPLGLDTHLINVVPDPENKFDRFAMIIELQFYNSYKMPKGFQLNVPQDIGYIPQRVSKVLHSKRDRLTQGKLINLYGDLHKGIYFGRISFPYGNKPRNYSSHNMQRFIEVMEST